MRNRCYLHGDQCLVPQPVWWSREQGAVALQRAPAELQLERNWSQPQQLALPGAPLLRRGCYGRRAPLPYIHRAPTHHRDKVNTRMPLSVDRPTLALGTLRLYSHTTAPRARAWRGCCSAMTAAARRAAAAPPRRAPSRRPRRRPLARAPESVFDALRGCDAWRGAVTAVTRQSASPCITTELPVKGLVSPCQGLTRVQ